MTTSNIVTIVSGDPRQQLRNDGFLPVSRKSKYPWDLPIGRSFTVELTAEQYMKGNRPSRKGWITEIWENKFQNTYKCLVTHRSES